MSLHLYSRTSASHALSTNSDFPVRQKCKHRIIFKHPVASYEENENVNIFLLKGYYFCGVNISFIEEHHKL
jgi:hypothetical protein